jgi:hypothetical protein
MEFGTTTSTTIQDFILSVLIIISNIVFKWIPAVVTVITGQPPTLFGVQSDANAIAQHAGSAAGQATQVAVDGTHYDATGVATSIPSDGAVPVAHVSPLSFAGDTLQTAWHIFAPLSIFISLLLAMALVYAMVRFFQIRFAERVALHALARPTLAPAVAAPGIRIGANTPPVVLPADPTEAQKRWKRIQEQIVSPGENDWRLAILESDIMLGDALTARRYVGDSIGEQLKGLTRSDLASLDAAWDAHKVRNHIAHRGSTHDLNQREARRVIAEYEQVFRELGLL